MVCVDAHIFYFLILSQSQCRAFKMTCQEDVLKIGKKLEKMISSDTQVNAWLCFDWLADLFHVGTSHVRY